MESFPHETRIHHKIVSQTFIFIDCIGKKNMKRKNGNIFEEKKAIHKRN